MSWKQSGMVWEIVLRDSEGVSRESKKFVLLAMADHADHEGNNVFPGIGLLAWKTDLHPRHVMRVIRALISDGIVVLVDARNNRYRTHCYKLQLEKAGKKPPYVPKGKSTGDTLSPVKSTGDISGSTGDISGSTGDMTLSENAPNRHIEPPVQPSKRGHGPGSPPEDTGEPIIYGHGRTSRRAVRCTCGKKVPFDWKLSRTECCGVRIVWNALEPDTPLAKYLASAFPPGWGFSSLKQKRRWVDDEMRCGEALHRKTDYVLEHGRNNGARFIADKILDLLERDLPPTRQPDSSVLEPSTGGDVVSQMNMQAVLADAARRQKEKAEGKD